MGKGFLLGVALALVASAAIADESTSRRGLGERMAVPPNGSPAFLADPGTYNLIFEDQYFRVLSVIWKAGNIDYPHTHPVPGVAYYLNDCPTLRIHSIDGNIREVHNKAGTAGSIPLALQPHRAENPGQVNCRAIIVERK